MRSSASVTLIITTEICKLQKQNAYIHTNIFWSNAGKRDVQQEFQDNYNNKTKYAENI